MENSSTPRFDFHVTSAETLLMTDVSALERNLEVKRLSDGKDLANFVIQHSVRRTLPYGRWTCADGRQVLFNREYQPILQCREGFFSHCDRNEWVGQSSPIVKTEYFYDDLTSPARYLVKHLGRRSLSASEAKACRKALLICLDKLKEFTPEEPGSVSWQHSARRL